MPVELLSDLEQKDLDLVLDRAHSEGWRQLDVLESAFEELPQTSNYLRHIFTPGLYTREIFMPKGQFVISRTHLLEHPFIILKGVVSVWTLETGWIKFTAPYMGVTQPGTRRLLYTHEHTVWVTSHVTDKTDPDEIVLDVTYSKGKYAQLGGAASHKALLLSR